MQDPPGFTYQLDALCWKVRIWLECPWQSLSSPAGRHLCSCCYCPRGPLHQILQRHSDHPAEPSTTKTLPFHYIWPLWTFRIPWRGPLFREFSTLLSNCLKNSSKCFPDSRIHYQTGMICVIPTEINHTPADAMTLSHEPLEPGKSLIKCKHAQLLTTLSRVLRWRVIGGKFFSRAVTLTPETLTVSLFLLFIQPKNLCHLFWLTRKTKHELLHLSLL